jgi:mannan endo-1,6-alpha-mannosidase
MKGTAEFFQRGIMYEGCEASGKCNTDQRSFKAYLARWMAATTKIAPFTQSYIIPLLASSAKAAVGTCTGGASGTICGHQWTVVGWDGHTGVGEQMSALEMVQSNLIGFAPDPFTNKTGGTSQGNPNAGTGNTNVITDTTVTTADRAGAGILTALMIMGVVGGTAWMCIN